MHVRLLLALMALLAILPGCVGRDDEPISQEILRLEARYPVISDLDITTGTRVRFLRSDGSEGILQNVPGNHSQHFEPNDAYTLDDVIDEIVEIGAASGWAMEQTPIGSWCGTNDELSPPAKFSVFEHPAPILPDTPPYVSVTIAAGC